VRAGRLSTKGYTHVNRSGARGRLHSRPYARTITAMAKVMKKSARMNAAAKRPATVLGRSARTGKLVLRPAGKGGTVTMSQVRSALRALAATGDAK
jgi:hypothetical protein